MRFSDAEKMGELDKAGREVTERYSDTFQYEGMSKQPEDLIVVLRTA